MLLWPEYNNYSTTFVNKGFYLSKCDLKKCITNKNIKLMSDHIKSLKANFGKISQIRIYYAQLTLLCATKCATTPSSF